MSSLDSPQLIITTNQLTANAVNQKKCCSEQCNIEERFGL